MANLSKGAKGKPVALLQKALNKKGAKPKLKEDSDFGPLTDAALRAFQKKNKMKTDGVAGPNTNFALNLGPRPKTLKWPIEGFDPKKEMKRLEGDIKEAETEFKKYVGILKTALAENDSLKKAIVDRAKMLSDRKKRVDKFGTDLIVGAKELLSLQLAAEKSNNFAEISEMYNKAEAIFKTMDDEDVDKAAKDLTAFEDTIGDIEEFQEGVKALKSKLKKAA